jgi:hypothetical protein
MKRLFKEFHKQMEIGCYPINPLPVYIFMIIALIYSLYETFK